MIGKLIALILVAFIITPLIFLSVDCWMQVSCREFGMFCYDQHILEWKFK